MQYGYFDDQKKEYTITNPETPASWSNYLGDTEYGAIITNNAGGYSFFKSAFNGRFMRFRTNSVPLDQPGRYLYIRDDESGDYWSASWQPVGKPLEDYKSECRHGTAYTEITSQYSSIESKTFYYVPLGQRFECWALKLTNTGDRPRNISLFTYCEFSSHWNLLKDQVDIQYTQYIVKGDMYDGVMQISCNHHVDENLDDFQADGQGRNVWMTLRGTPIDSFDTQRESFLGGPYRNYSNPIAVESGKCSGSEAHGDSACGSLHSSVTLAPGETKEIVVLLGVGKVDEEKISLADAYGTWSSVEEELNKLKDHWHSRLGQFECRTPDSDFNSMINVWNAYNCLITYSWSRAASLVYNGERDGLGFRDTVQDLLGVMPLIPEEARERLVLMLTGQFSNGGAIHVVKPYSHKPGHETINPDDDYRSDDCLWFFDTIAEYAAETGNLDFYRQVVPYADKGEASVLGHLKNALMFNLQRMGAHGLPCGLTADWNDTMRLGQKGESLFITFQLRYGLRKYAGICRLLQFEEEAAWAEDQCSRLDDTIEQHAWDGEWFIRGFHEDGSPVGSKNSDENHASLFLNSQSWAVISGAATEQQREKALDTVWKRLSTEYGIMVCDPPFKKGDINVFAAVLFNEGQKENAGIFCHPQGWAVMAECLNGNGDRAYEYYRNFMPSAYNDRAEIRVSEPYVHAQSTHSRYSRKYGTTRLPWLSGTAAWAYHSATHYILGIFPEYNGLRIDPCIPSRWDKFTVTKVFRNKKIHITVANPQKLQTGIGQLICGGKKITGNFIPVEMLEDGMEVLAEIGV